MLAISNGSYYFNHTLYHTPLTFSRSHALTLSRSYALTEIYITNDLHHYHSFLPEDYSMHLFLMQH